MLFTYGISPSLLYGLPRVAFLAPWVPIPCVVNPKSSIVYSEVIFVHSLMLYRDEIVVYAVDYIQ